MTYDELMRATDRIVETYRATHGSEPSYRDVTHIIARVWLEPDRFPTLDHALADWTGVVPPNPQPTIPHKATDRLHRVGTTLRHDDDSFAFLTGVTGFPIVDMWIREGPSRIAPFVDWGIAGLGYGCEFRALGMAFGGVGGWTVDYPGANPAIRVRFTEREYFDGLDSLCRWLKARGGRLKLSLFADCVRRDDGTGGTMPDRNVRYRFAQKVMDMLEHRWDMQSHTNARIDAGNEASKNGFDGDLDFPDSTGAVLASRGSGQMDENPSPRKPLDYCDVHTSRIYAMDQAGRRYLDQWRRYFRWLNEIKTGANNVPQVARPGGVDEPIGVGEVFEDGRTTIDPQAYGEFAAGCKLFGDHVIVHTRCGIRELRPGGPIATATLQAVREYVDLIPDDARTGNYTRGGIPDKCPIDHDDAKALRTFAMLHGDKGTVLVLDPSPDWRAVARNGWRIESQAGPKGQIVRMQR